MGGIYANSSVTILAIQGNHADSGLRGFHGISEPRNLQQVVHYLEDRTKILQFPAEGQFHDVECLNPRWSTRAWTYQENMCSPRKLIFDGDSLRWECMENVWREHIDGNVQLDTPYRGVAACRSMLQASIPEFSEFQMVLNEYNCREFSYPEDATDAFSGISHCISAAVGGELITGLPSVCFDVFLLWSPQTRVSRRQPIDSTRAGSLPSWSWVGWSGAISINIGSAAHFLKKSPSKIYRAANSHILTSLVEWKRHERPDIPGVPINPGISRQRALWLKDELSLTSEWSMHDIWESPELECDLKNLNYTPATFFKNAKHPEYEFRYPIPIAQPESKPSVINPSFISCCTRRAYMLSAERIRKFYGKAPVFSLRDEYGRWVGALEPLVRFAESADRMNMQEDELVEVVELARGCCPDTTASETGIEELDHPERRGGTDDGWYHFHWVMWIEWEEEVAYRKGIGRICSTVWETQSKEHINLMLG
ncbi:heterokaryon incompatibility protein [Beauveria bassiana ARSEF 2860]|uniref:Heterokaryon incompatibility protein n=1 Tax=Beauveria bassiana (strain ARSEF 2860) TaxID=655819 RepID=J4VQG1_BEAB2|nr:heterokaryon incompatibility protein [Beauveria bassiana ARSEF 2860]EJP60925.1 heterokaryon incompatibility protein [Beauveria bassiana ARSEF 2860]